MSQTYREELLELFKKAQTRGFAIPSFNYSDIWDLRAIVAAADKHQVPVMLAANPMVVDCFDLELLGAIGRVFTGRYQNVYHHLDHASSPDVCMEAVDEGFESVMIDGAALPLEENIAVTKKVVDYAHARGVLVEGELGHMVGEGPEGTDDTSELFTKVDEAIEFVDKTGVDLLAISIGTQHGIYTGEPDLDFTRLEELEANIDIPMVLHGGSGTPAADVQRAIRHGICKVNVGTDIHTTYMNSLKEELNKRPANPYTLDVMGEIEGKIVAKIEEWIEIFSLMKSKQ